MGGLDYDLDTQIEIIASRGAIIVQPNNRVGALGFWSTQVKFFQTLKILIFWSLA